MCESLSLDWNGPYLTDFTASVDLFSEVAAKVGYFATLQPTPVQLIARVGQQLSVVFSRYLAVGCGLSLIALMVGKN